MFKFCSCIVEYLWASALAIGIALSNIAWDIAAAAIEDAPKPLWFITAFTLRIAGDTQGGNSAPSLREAISCSTWNLVVASAANVCVWASDKLPRSNISVLVRSSTIWVGSTVELEVIAPCCAVAVGRLVNVLSTSATNEGSAFVGIATPSTIVACDATLSAPTFVNCVGPPTSSVVGS